MQQRRVIAHRGIDVGDVSERLVVDLDQRERPACNRVTGSGDRGHRMTFVQDLVASHQVAQGVVHRRIVADVGKVGSCDDRLHAGKRKGLGRIDRAHACMWMRTSQHLADEHPRREGVRPVARPPGYFLDSVGARGALAHDLVGQRI